MKEMTARRRAVLGLVIRSYIENELPVGSKAFVQGYGLGISPATVRNEMAVLEEMGYLTHPHPSAGRVPTEAGYRFFVENLLGETELPLVERRMIAHQFHQARLELDQWARLAAAVLAHATRTAAVATPPRSRASQFKHLELVSLRYTMTLLVLVLQGGTLKQRMLFLEEPAEQEALSALSNLLNDHLSGLPAKDIRARQANLPALGQQVSEVVLEMMEAVDAHAEDAMYREGLAQILAEPEFTQREQVHQAVLALEGPLLLEVITTASGPLEVGGIQVLIGGEGRWEDLRELSLVLSRYGVEDGATGLLGVVGPLRMPYDRTIGAVRYVSQLMTDLVSDWYGPSQLPADEMPPRLDQPAASPETRYE
jgi:heat-inducible transcriptional repressor